MLSGTYKGLEESVVASFTEGEETKYAGGIYTATYGEDKHKLVLVPLPGVTIDAMTVGSIQQQLNQIYAQAVVSWSVSQKTDFKADGVDLGGNGLDWADSDLLSSYTAEMNALIDAYKTANSSLPEDTYYLFVVPAITDGVNGYMPRARRFGFIAKASASARTIAHELGHGAFNLSHTFPVLPKATTDNLMDYPPAGGQAEGSRLIKPQWDLIHNPELTTGLLDDESEGASANNAIRKTNFELINLDEESRFDDNDSSSCHRYLTYLTNNPIQKGARWYYTSAGRTNMLKINVTPPRLSNNVILHSKDNRVTLSNIQKGSNPITFTFSTAAANTGMAILTKQDSINGKQTGGLNIISCKPRHFNISIYLLQDSTKTVPPNVNFQDIQDYFNKVYGAINITATFTITTVRMNFFRIFDIDNDWKLNETREDRLLRTYSVDNIQGYKVYIIDIPIVRLGLAPNQFIHGLAAPNTNYPLLNNTPVAIVTTDNNPYVQSSVTHELGHLIFGFHDVFRDIPNFTTYDDQFNIMDYVRPGSSLINNDRKLRAYQVLEIQTNTP